MSSYVTIGFSSSTAIKKIFSHLPTKNHRCEEGWKGKRLPNSVRITNNSHRINRIQTVSATRSALQTSASARGRRIKNYRMLSASKNRDMTIRIINIAATLSFLD